MSTRPPVGALLPPSDRRAAEALVDPDAVLYVHCAMGSNRGPCDALAIPVGRFEWTIDDGVSLLAQHRLQVGLLHRSDVEAACPALGGALTVVLVGVGLLRNTSWRPESPKP